MDAMAAGEVEGRRAAAPPAARWLATLAAAVAGTVLPVAMVLANKSAPASLGLAAVLANAAVICGSGGPALWRRYARVAGSTPARLVAAIAALGCLSLLWSVDRAMTWRGLVEALPVAVFGLMLAAAWPLVRRPHDVRWLMGGLVAAGVLIVFERVFGMPLHAIVHARGEAWDLKRSAIPPVLLLWAAAGVAMGQARPWLAAGLFVAVGAGIVASHSGAPGFALMAATGIGLLARRAPTLAVRLVAVAVVALILLSPWTGTLVARALPPAVAAALSEQHAAHRMRIWAAFEERVPDHWILGHGFDASFKVSTAPRPAGRPAGPGNAEMRDNHPHNVFLEVWVELGLVGALSALGCAAVIFVRLSRLEATSLAPRLAFLASIIGIGLVGLSAWQPWWLATIFAALLWFAPPLSRVEGPIGGGSAAKGH